MEVNVTLDNKRINAIVHAAYNLTNKVGLWTSSPESTDDSEMLNALTLVHSEMKALFAACPSLDRPQTDVEVKTLVGCSIVLMARCASAFPNIDRVPALMRSEIKALYWALNDAKLIEPQEE